MMDAFSRIVAVLDEIAPFFSGKLWIVGLCILCACAADDLRDRYILHFWVTLASGFGGGATSGLLLMRPDVVPLNLAIMNLDVIWTMTWWLANYFPFDLTGKVLRWAPVQLVSKVATQVVKAKTICARVSQTLLIYPSASVLAIIMGCSSGSMGGCGGKIIHDMLRGGYHLQKSVDEFTLPGLSLHGALLSSALYYYLVHVVSVLTALQGTTLVQLLLVSHVILLEVTGFDWMAPLVRLFHILCNIPQPRLSKSTQPSSSAFAVSSKKRS